MQRVFHRSAMRPRCGKHCFETGRYPSSIIKSKTALLPQVGHALHSLCHSLRPTREPVSRQGRKARAGFDVGLTNDIPEESTVQPLLTDSGNAARNLRKNRRGDKTGVIIPVLSASGASCHPPLLFRQIYRIVTNLPSQFLAFVTDIPYFYSRRNRSRADGTMEIDFIVKKGIKTCPVEVKSANYKSHISLDRYSTRYGKHLGARYVLCRGGYAFENGITYLPLYMAHLI